MSILADSLVSLLRTGSLLPLVCVAFILFVLGNRVVAGESKFEIRGYACAIPVLVLWVGGEVLAGSAGSAGDLLEILIRACIAAAITCGLAWLILPLGELFDLKNPIPGIRQRIHNWWRPPPRHRRLIWDGRPGNTSSDIEVCDAIEEETDEEDHNDEQQAVADLCFDMVVFYERHRKTIEGNLTRERLDAMLDEFIKGEHPVEVVRRRCEQLQLMMQSHVDQSADSSSPRFESIAEIKAHYAGQRQKIEAMSNEDGPEQDVFMHSIDEAEQSAIEDFLRHN